MRYILTAILFSSVPAISLAAQTMHGERPGDFYSHSGGLATKSSSGSPMSSRLANKSFFIT